MVLIKSYPICTLGKANRWNVFFKYKYVYVFSADIQTFQEIWKVQKENNLNFYSSSILFVV